MSKAFTDDLIFSLQAENARLKRDYENVIRQRDGLMSTIDALNSQLDEAQPGAELAELIRRIVK